MKRLFLRRRVCLPWFHSIWQLASDFERTLRQIGERGDIIRTMQRAFTARGIDRAPVDQAIYDPGARNVAPLVGRLTARGLADEHADRHYLIIDGGDGRSHFVGVGKGADLAAIPEGAIVRIVPQAGQVRVADRTVAAVAAANNGRYDVDAHLRYDPSATEAFAETHVRRLEAIRSSCKHLSCCKSRELGGCAGTALCWRKRCVDQDQTVIGTEALLDCATSARITIASARDHCAIDPILSK